MLKPLSFLPAIVVMYLIFSFSSQDGVSSAQLSRKVSHKVVVMAERVLDKGWSDAQVESYTEHIHYYVRKTAHVTEYFVLAGTFCVGFAGLDEYHQSFVAGRGPSAHDVAIDSIGILPGIILVRIVGFIGRKTIFRPLALQKKPRRR